MTWRWNRIAYCTTAWLGLVAGSILCWWWLICYQPSFWLRAAERVSINSHKKLARFDHQLDRLEVQLAAGEPFRIELAEDEITAWCRRVLEAQHFRELPYGATWLLVALRRDHFLFGFQDVLAAGRPVISMRVRPQLVDGSRLRFEISDVRRGRLPLPFADLQTYLDGLQLPGGMQIEWAGVAESSAHLVLHMDPQLVGRGLCLTRFESLPDRIVIEGDSPR